MEQISEKLFDYWYAQEFFSPCYPIKPKSDIDLNKNPLPWLNVQIDPQWRVSYNIYFGKISVADLVQWMQEELELEPENNAEKNTSSTCVFAIKIDETGRYVSESFVISSFVWAVSKLVAVGSIHNELESKELETLQTTFDKKLTRLQEDSSFVCSEEFLKQLFETVCEHLHLEKRLAMYAAWSHEIKEHANKDGKFPPLNPSTELLQSFYLKDIKRVQASSTDQVRQYMTSLITKENTAERMEIDCDIVRMRHWLEAEQFPLGAWPAQYSPSLMQQIGINLAISGEQKVFSINGPPGTGKTTLLKEIIASNVVQRAIVMCRYNCPDDAFIKQTFENPIDQYNKTFYELDPKISGYGILVASNNNAAVENISIELPKQIGQDRTKRFSGQYEVDETYFGDVATQLLGQPAWGLISARLGKKKNLSELKNRLWWAEDDQTLKAYFKRADEDSASVQANWENAKSAFQSALDAVMDERKNIHKAQKLLGTLDEAKKIFYKAQATEEFYRNDTAQKTCLAESKERLEKIQNGICFEEENAQLLRKRISWFKWMFRAFYKKDAVLLEWTNTQERITRLELELIQCRRKMQSLEQQENQAQRLLEDATKIKMQKETELKAIQDQIAEYKLLFKGNWADETFWNDIPSNETSQAACPWTYTHYDTLREELFYQALMLHKAFILYSKAMKQNLKRLFVVWDGKIIGTDRKAAYPHLFNTLQLLLPVVSTTFAAIESFLADIGAQQLGVLVVDEAGQATPQSALGAMWRTQKAIIVGDPFQVEPIVTIPAVLRKCLADDSEIPNEYRIPELSVQILADQMNQYGGKRVQNGEDVWLGCPLVVHRRCIDPMFTISNQVAYNGKMFCKTSSAAPEKKFLLKESVWFDCVGQEKGNQDHSVQKQIELVGTLLRQAISLYDGLPDIYFITPFTTVADAITEQFQKVLKATLSQLDVTIQNEWIKSHCGTVHTFQGKEASEVILVLGCDGESGMGAARWVGQKPNIVNVAVSRAKYRLGVVGDWKLWQNIPYVQDICKHVPVAENDSSLLQ